MSQSVELVNQLWTSIDAYGVNRPTPRRNFTCVSISLNKLLIFGGFNNELYYNELFIFSTINGAHWEKIQPSSVARQNPLPLAGHSAVVLGNSMFVFGGHLKTTPLDFLFALDLKSFSWKMISDAKGEAPTSRYGHSAVKISENEMLIFGGFDNSQRYRNLFIYNCIENEWRKVKSASGDPPTGRFGHSAVFTQGKLYIFGGKRDKKNLNDFYSFDLATLSWKRILAEHTPSPRYDHSMIVCGNLIIVSGGTTTGSQLLDDVYHFNLLSGEWFQDLSVLQLPRLASGHSTGLIGSTLYLLGGESEDSVTLSVLSASIETNVPTMPKSVSAAMADPRNKVLPPLPPTRQRSQSNSDLNVSTRDSLSGSGNFSGVTPNPSIPSTNTSNTNISSTLSSSGSAGELNRTFSTSLAATKKIPKDTLPPSQTQTPSPPSTPPVSSPLTLSIKKSSEAEDSPELNRSDLISSSNESKSTTSIPTANELKLIAAIESLYEDCRQLAFFIEQNPLIRKDIDLLALLDRLPKSTTDLQSRIEKRHGYPASSFIAAATRNQGAPRKILVRQSSESNSPAHFLFASPRVHYNTASAVSSAPISPTSTSGSSSSSIAVASESPRISRISPIGESLFRRTTSFDQKTLPTLLSPKDTAGDIYLGHFIPLTSRIERTLPLFAAKTDITSSPVISDDNNTVEIPSESSIDTNQQQIDSQVDAAPDSDSSVDSNVFPMESLGEKITIVDEQTSSEIIIDTIPITDDIICESPPLPTAESPKEIELQTTSNSNQQMPKSPTANSQQQLQQLSEAENQNQTKSQATLSIEAKIAAAVAATPVIRTTNKAVLTELRRSVSVSRLQSIELPSQSSAIVSSTKTTATMSNMPVSQLETPLDVPIAEVGVDSSISGANARKSRNRVFAVREIITSERTFANDLDLVCTNYIDQLTGSRLLSRQQVDLIFLNWEEIREVSRALVKAFDLLERTPTASHSLASVFLKLVVLFDVYLHYCIHQEHAIHYLREMRKSNAQFTAFLHQKSNRAELGRLDLSSYLIKPVQRICKYPLLFKAVIANTPESHPEYTDYVKALNASEEILKNIEKAKTWSDQTHTDNQRFIIELQSNITVDGEEPIVLIHPLREFKRQGQLKKIRVNDEEICYDIFLFNDLILIGNMDSSNNKFWLRSWFPLNTTRLSAFKSIGTVVFRSTTYALKLWRTDSSSYAILYFDGSESMESWCKLIQKTIDSCSIVYPTQ